MFFCFGIGYTAQALIRRLMAQGVPCVGTCREAEKRDRLRAGGIQAVPYDSPDIPKLLHSATMILNSVPPDAEGDPVLRRYGDVIDAHAELDWVGYLSTTGVYGDHEGRWVNETTPVNPTDDRLKRRVQAEQDWLTLQRRHALPVHIYRLSGIYGPGRSAVDQAKKGEARRIYKEGQFFSRIHVEDIAETLLRSMQYPAPGGIYNVCDDEPAPSHEVVEYACHLLGLAPPPMIPFEKADLTEMARSFYLSNRRVSNRKIREGLEVELRYPTYREGLESIIISTRI